MSEGDALGPLNPPSCAPACHVVFPIAFRSSPRVDQHESRVAARALAPQGIRVNGIAPALMLQSRGQTAENCDRMHRSKPLGRGVDPAHVADAIRFLSAADIPDAGGSPGSLVFPSNRQSLAAFRQECKLAADERRCLRTGEAGGTWTVAVAAGGSTDAHSPRLR